MNRSRVYILVLALLVSLAIAGIVLASSSEFAIQWFRIGPGQRSSCTMHYSLAGNVGLPATGELEGGGYSLVGGTQFEAAECRSLSLPVILKR